MESTVTLTIAGRETHWRVRTDEGGSVMTRTDNDPPAAKGQRRIIGFSERGQVLRREVTDDFRRQIDAREGAEILRLRSASNQTTGTRRS